jgi:amino acid permease
MENRKHNWKLFSAIATLTGTIIGAGFLGLPYVVAKSGFFIGFALILIIGFLMVIITLYLGEISLRTKDTHQLPGLAKLYLGKAGGKIMFYCMLFGIYFASIAYLMGEGESLSVIFLGTMDYAIYFSFGLWVLISIFVYHGIKAIKKGNSFGLILASFILLLIVVLFSPSIKAENLAYYNLKNAFIPIGVIMFSLMGYSAVPEARRVLFKNESLMKKTISSAMLIAMAFYTIFTLVVIGYSGTSTPEIATISLGKPFILLGIITMFTAYFGSSIAMRDIYRFDLNFSKLKAWILSCFVPFILFLIIHFFNLANFVDIIGFTGAIFGTINGIMILLMVRKARKIGKRKPEYKVKLPPWATLVLIILLVIGLACELFL